MTGEQSRLLKVGDRVQWDNSLTDRGTISDVDWRGVTIKWDDGRTNSIYHNDMGQVERVPANLGELHWYPVEVLVQPTGQGLPYGRSGRQLRACLGEFNIGSGTAPATVDRQLGQVFVGYCLGHGTSHQLDMDAAVPGMASTELAISINLRAAFSGLE